MLKFPAGHVRHAVAAGLLKVPNVQGVQEPASLPLTEPALQAAQGSDPLENVPAEQGLQELCPPGLYRPAAQGWQAVEGLGEKVLGGQARQLGAAPRLYKGATQLEQEEELAVLNWPAGQSAHGVDVVAANRPAAQPVQAEALPRLKLPEEHVLHIRAAGPEKLPLPHTIQAKEFWESEYDPAQQLAH